MNAACSLKFSVTDGKEVSALLSMPENSTCLLVLAHGAGAGMTHPFLEQLAQDLAAAHVGTFRYQFPYMEQGGGMPDQQNVLSATVAAAVKTAAKLAEGSPVFAGGKSLGGRMTSSAAAENLLEGVRGIVFFGFPLHPANRPGTKRAEHLKKVKIPMLFLQGTRDQLADLNLLRPICEELGSLATLHIVEGADHSFHVLKRSGKTDDGVLTELAQTFSSWAQLDGSRNI